tara:strand:+ start:4333 stop:4809 length:477 start_codon:yes stop_codon:yes gene_type:complete
MSQPAKTWIGGPFGYRGDVESLTNSIKDDIMIGEMPPGQCPNVGRHDGKIAILAKDDGVDHGFLLHPDGAVELAVKILGAVADTVDAEGKAGFGHEVTALRLQAADFVQHREARLTFALAGAPFHAILTDVQVTELAAAFRAAADWIDKPNTAPRRNV